MGAQQFMQTGAGLSVQDAFRAAKNQAEWEHGHGGYSGTLAEKHSFVEISVPKGIDPTRFAEIVLHVGKMPGERAAGDLTDWEKSMLLKAHLTEADLRDIDAAYSKIDDKWGPAGAVKVSPAEWLFFGWASS